MRSIPVSTEVFARIWALRKKGEETEDDILRRILQDPEPSGQSDGTPSPSGDGSGDPLLDAIGPPSGYHDRRFNVHFPEGFEIFRNYHGRDFVAHARGGRWVLQGGKETFQTLNEISVAIGAKVENAWANWFYRAPDGRRRLISDLRDPSKIQRRRRHKEATST